MEAYWVTPEEEVELRKVDEEYWLEDVAVSPSYVFFNALLSC